MIREWRHGAYRRDIEREKEGRREKQNDNGKCKERCGQKNKNNIIKAIKVRENEKKSDMG